MRTLRVSGIEDLPKKLDSADPETVYTFSGVDVYIPPAAEHDMTSLRAALGSSRRIKTAGEIEMIRAASEISAESHNLLMKHIRWVEWVEWDGVVVMVWGGGGGGSGNACDGGDDGGGESGR
jgi:Xaa-Pro aminopeptidase